MKRLVILIAVLGLMAAASSAAGATSNARTHPHWIHGTRTPSPSRHSKGQRSFASLPIPTTTSHAQCVGYGTWYAPPSVKVWIPQVDPVSALGFPQRAYWQSDVWEQSRYGVWSEIGTTPMAYMDSVYTGAWYDAQTNVFLGTNGALGVAFPLRSDTVRVWVGDAYVFFNRSTGSYVTSSTSVYLSCV
jgi:hypothetical protein